MANNSIRRPPLPECILTFRPDILKNHNDIALLVVYSTTALFIIVANVLLIIALFNTKKNSLTRASKLFIILCLFDLLVGLILMPIQIAYVAIAPDISCLQVAIRAFWNPFPLILSGLHVTLISFDRFYLITRHTSYQKNFTNKILAGLIVLEILIAFSWGAGYAAVSQDINLETSGTYFLTLSVFEALILLAAVTFNILIRQNVHGKSTTTIATTASTKNKDRRLTKTILLITISLCLFYIPSIISLAATAFFFLYSKNRDDLRKVTITLVWTLLITSINSGVNSCIYMISNSKVRRYLHHVISRRELHNHDTATESMSSHENLRINTIDRKSYTNGRKS